MTPPPFLLPVAARLREFDEGPAGDALVAVMPNSYERMAVGLQGLLLGALAVLQEWDEEGNDTGEVGFVNIGVLRQGLRECGALLPRKGAREEPDEGQAPPGVGSGWGRDKGCESP